MGRSRIKARTVMFDAADANGVSEPMRVVGYETVQLQVSSANNGACVLRVQGSQTGPTALPAENDPPDFSATRAFDNHWDYVGSFDMETSTGVRGDTGYTLAGVDEDNCFNVMVSCDGLEWLSCEISSYSAGDIYVTGFGYSIV